MYEVSAHAVRVDSTIEVTVYGYLPDSCHEAHIVDIYPGGNIIYIKDPGFAQVFIRETAKPNSQFCTPKLVPFVATTYIHDTGHEEVEILVNHYSIYKAPILKRGAKYIVIQLTGGIVPKGHCSIIPEGPYSGIYSKVFGPASYDSCQDFIEKECPRPSSGPLLTASGGGSEAPRGLL